MKRLCTVLATIGLLTAFSVGAWAHDDLLEADTMVGVDGPFVGTTNPIRGVNGGGLPWVLDEAKVELDSDGMYVAKPAKRRGRKTKGKK